MIATKSMVSKMKLKIKFPTKRVEGETGTRLRESGQQVSDINCGLGSSDNVNVFAAELSKMNSPKPGSKKRGPPGLKDQASKRQKMDRRITQQCSSVLQQLLAHPAAWPFRAPVDPVELNIPDYFSVISEPMDLGTIRSKMDKNMYLGAEEFAADVRLTFSNAMTYNPPDNPIHNYAKRLNSVFETRWKCVGDKWNHESSKVGQGKMSSGQKKEICNARRNCPKTPPLRNDFLPKRSVPLVGKVVRSSLDARATNADLLKTKQNCTRKLDKSFHKGIVSDSRHVCGSKCGSCGNFTCQCSHFSDSTHASSDLSSERSLGCDQRACSADASKVDCQPKRPPTSHMSKSDPDSDGAVSTMEDENMYPSSQLITPATEATSREGWQTPLLDLQLSPKKALRVAMLKSRFADTILKAQQKTLLGNKADPVKMQLEKERLERKQCEEKARIEALIKATKAASQVRAEETELKKQREREREAARIAVQKMKKTVEIDLNLESLRELEMLSGCSPEALEGAHIRSPLERLGLFLKHDYLADEEDEAILSGEGEEGEILL